jgi:predicted transcriptional regulator
MLGDSDIRKLIYSRLDDIKELMLTKKDIELIDFIKEKNTVTPSIVAQYRDININNASTKLKRLFDQGYLSRLNAKSTSGGVEYIYTVSIND